MTNIYFIVAFAVRSLGWYVFGLTIRLIRTVKLAYLSRHSLPWPPCYVFLSSHQLECFFGFLEDLLSNCKLVSVRPTLWRTPQSDWNLQHITNSNHPDCGDSSLALWLFSIVRYSLTIYWILARMIRACHACQVCAFIEWRYVLFMSNFRYSHRLTCET